MYPDIIDIRLIVLKIFLINFINKHSGSYKVLWTIKVDFYPIAND